MNPYGNRGKMIGEKTVVSGNPKIAKSYTYQCRVARKSSFFMAFNKALESVYDQAVAKNSWLDLIPYPYLLFRWQAKHKDHKTIIDIARIASHRLEKHKWCDTDGITCEQVENLIQEHSFKMIV